MSPTHLYKKNTKKTKTLEKKNTKRSNRMKLNSMVKNQLNFN